MQSMSRREFTMWLLAVATTTLGLCQCSEIVGCGGGGGGLLPLVVVVCVGVGWLSSVVGFIISSPWWQEENPPQEL